MRVHEAIAYNTSRLPLKRSPPLKALCSIRASRSPTGWLGATLFTMLCAHQQKPLKGCWAPTSTMLRAHLPAAPSAAASSSRRMRASGAAAAGALYGMAVNLIGHTPWCALHANQPHCMRQFISALE